VLRYARRLARIAVMSSITAPNARDLEEARHACDPPPATGAALSEAAPPDTMPASARHIEPG
jgi:hypothetical protein